MSTGNLSCGKSDWKVLQFCFWKLRVETTTASQIAFENFVEPSQNLPLKVRKPTTSLVPHFWCSEVVCRFLLKAKEGTGSVQYAQDRRVVRCGQCSAVRIGFPTVEGPDIVNLGYESISILLRLLRLSLTLRRSARSIINLSSFTFRHLCSYFPRIIYLIKQKQHRQYTYNVTSRHVNIIVAVGKQ
jgi:hypothetical protein